MPIAEDEALACLKVLVAIAKADGKLTSTERKSLAGAITGLQQTLSADELLAEDVDLDAELAKVHSAEAKEQLFRSAHFMANADAKAAPEEKALLDRIEAVTTPSEELRTQVAALAPPPAAARLSAWASNFGSLFKR